MTASTFKRQPPPLPVRLFFGLMMDGVLRPVIRVLDKFGRGDRPYRSIRKRQNQDRAAKNPFKGYVPTKHDVFVAVYVKSGTNWTMQITHQLLNHGKGEYDHIHDVVTWPDTKLMGPMSNYAVPLEDESAWHASPEQKRVIKTHFNWEDLPYSEDARYILVIRDPKDVFVSSYFFFGTQFPMPSVDTFFKLFCSDDFMFGSWAKSAAGYWAQRHRPNVLVLSFKSMKRDLPDAVRKIADFLNIQPDERGREQVIRTVCEKSSFEFMKTIDHKFEVWKMIPWHTKTPMMRKGAVGGSSELLTPEKQREMDAYFMAELKQLGSDLPYEEFCEVTPPAKDRAGATSAA